MTSVIATIATIATVCERIQVSKDAYMKECPQDVITALQQLKQSREKIKFKEIENEQLRYENKELESENEELRNKIEEEHTIIGELEAIIDQMVMATNMLAICYSYCVLFLVLHKEYTNTRCG